mgnify:CR=1 FL=1
MLSLKQIKLDLKLFYKQWFPLRSKQARLNLLKEYSIKKYGEPYPVYGKRRINFNKKKGRHFKEHKFKHCKVCFNSANIRHHIISFNNGNA